MGEMQDQSDTQILHAHIVNGQETALREIVMRTEAP